MQPDRHQPDDADLDAPPKLVEALRRAGNQTVFVPPSVDASVRAAARGHLRQVEPRRIVWLPVARWAAMAASLALVLWFVTPAIKRLGPAAFAPEDINRDGRVDILDAFVLARELDRNGKPSASADVNHDGVVDRRDVDAIANKAVKLVKGGRS